MTRSKVYRDFFFTNHDFLRDYLDQFPLLLGRHHQPPIIEIRGLHSDFFGERLFTSVKVQVDSCYGPAVRKVVNYPQSRTGYAV